MFEVLGKLRTMYPKVESVNDSFALQDVIAAQWWWLSANTARSPELWHRVESKDNVVGKLHALYPKVESINDSFAFQDVIAARWLLSANTTRS
jgi:hypothetical protein